MDKIIETFLDESDEQLGNIESDILTLEKGFKHKTMDKIFRAFHTLKGNATTLGFDNMSSFAHKIENLLHAIRQGEKTVNKQIIDILLRCADEVKLILSDLRQGGEGNNDVRTTIELLDKVAANDTKQIDEEQAKGVNINMNDNNTTSTYTNEEQKREAIDKTIKVLIAEDDSINRTLLLQILKSSPNINFEIDIAVNGKEAVDLFEKAQNSNEQYELVLLDIMMPKMDGQEALEIIRSKETSAETPIPQQAKIIMTTALDDPKNVMKAYTSLCDGYLCKPIKEKQLFALLDDHGLTS